MYLNLWANQMCFLLKQHQIDVSNFGKLILLNWHLTSALNILMLFWKFKLICSVMLHNSCCLQVPFVYSVYFDCRLNAQIFSSSVYICFQKMILKTLVVLVGASKQYQRETLNNNILRISVLWQPIYLIYQVVLSFVVQTAV